MFYCHLHIKYLKWKKYDINKLVKLLRDAENKTDQFTFVNIFEIVLKSKVWKNALIET